MGELSPESGGAQASIFHAKGHLIVIQLQKTPRDGAEHGEGEEDAQGTVDEEQDSATRYQQGNGTPVEAGREGGRTLGGLRQADGVRYPWKKITLVPTGTWAQIKDGKGRNWIG